MDMFDFAGLLFGGSRTAPDATTVTATGAGASAGGEVGITLDADVTPAEDTGVEGDADQTIIDLPTSPDVDEGDEVIVTLVGDGPLKTPVVTANPGSGDRMRALVNAAQTVADAARAVADAVNQHFFADTNGIHVTEVTQEDWDESHSGANVLINALGQLFRDGLNNLLTLTTESGARALTIWDGLGNSASNILARFSSDGISFADGTSFDIGDSSSYIHFDGDGHINIGGSGLTIGGYIPTGGVTVSDLTQAAQDATLNSNISVGGRNLLLQSDYGSSFTQNGITFTNNGDGSVTANGEATGLVTFSFAPHVTLGAGTYTLSGCPQTGSNSTYRLDILEVPTSTGVTSQADFGGGVTFETVGGTTGAVRLRVASGATVNNVTVYPKLEKGNVATDWTPAPEDTPDQMTWYGTCSTEASTAAKVVACDGFELRTGARIAVKSTKVNTANAPTLNVNGTGAIATWYNNAVSSTTNPIRWGANATLNFIYDGSVWVLDERPPSYSATCSTAASTRSKAPSVVGALVVNGTRLSVRFSTANTYVNNSVQINLASTGAYSVYQNNAVTSTTNTLLWDANTILTFVAQGTYWHLLSRSDAAKTATSYVTEITGQNGIMVHPSTDQTTGVQVTDDVDIMRGGTSVAEYGETVRIGAESSDHVEIDSNELMFHDGTNAVMQVGGSCQITEKHVCGSSTSEVFYLSLKPSDGATFRVIDKNSEIVTSNYTLSRSGKRCTLTNKSGTALDGETVLVFYQSSGMVLYDEGDVSSTFTTDQASLAGGMFEMSYTDTYSSVDGTVTDSTAEISIGEHRDQFSSISLNATPSNNRSFMTFQASGNGYAAFVLDSGSTDYPERRLDLIYLDRINYADPYGGSDRQLGVPTRLTASGSYTAGTSDTMGPAVTLTAGIWLIEGSWAFTNSSSNSKRLAVGLYRSSTGNAYAYRIHTTASSSSVHRLEVSDTIVVSAASETVTLYGSSSPASTAAATQYITAIRLA